MFLCEDDVFVSAVHPVAMRRAVFCMICSLFTCVSEIIGDHTVLAYSICGLVMVLYVAKMVSLSLLHFVEVRAFSMLMVFDAFSLVCIMC